MTDLSTGMTRRDAIAMVGALALPPIVSSAHAEGTSQAAPVGPEPPDLANLHEMMAWLARANPPRLSFLDPRWRSVDDWKRAARAAYIAALNFTPPARPLAATSISREARDGFTIERVAIHATEAYDIPARVLVPDRQGGRRPGVVALHCHSGQYVWGHEKVLSSPTDPPPLTEFRDRLYGSAYAERLAKAGYVVLVIDAFYFGERRLRPEDLDPDTAPLERDAVRALRALTPGTGAWLETVNRICGRYEELTAKTLFTAGVNWPGLLVWDDRRSLDYLCARPEVDPERIGCVGLSIGGLRAARLIGADPRVKAACVTGWMTELPAQMRNHLRSHTWMLYVPNLAGALDLPDVAALTMPGALLVQQCSRDALYPRAALEASVETLTRIYAKAGLPGRFRGTFYDEPHSFRPRMQDEALAWLERWL